MTTTPKARKFRIRRSDALPAPHEDVAAEPHPDRAVDRAILNTPEALLTAAQRPEDGFGDLALPGSAAAMRTAPRGDAPAGTPPVTGPDAGVLAAIRAEGLTGRQLRLARRVAARHGLHPTSGLDAVRLLRDQGIDPFAPARIAAGADAVGAGAPPAAGTDITTGVNLPVLSPPNPVTVPATVPAPAAPPRVPDAGARAVEITRVQRDIAQRRRRRMALLAARLSIFVVLPTLLVGYYYFAVATPLYATQTEFVIQKAEGTPAGMGGMGGLGGLLGGGASSTVQESIIVQSYLESREALQRLDAELGFRAHFSAPALDPLTRLAPDAPAETVYDTYRNHLTIGFDPTEGVVRMEVRAADPATSQAYSEALLRYAEERVDQMTQRLREDQMEGALESYAQAEARMAEAQARVLALQETRGVLSAEAEVSNIFQQIATFELALQQERLRLAEIQAAPRPNPSRVEVAQNSITQLEGLLAQLRGGLTQTQAGGASLARIQSELEIAQADLQTRQMMLAQALQHQEAARIEAVRQSLYLSVGVAPVQPDRPAYPRAFENTMLAFLVFAGIYLMLSMTASILREQVSS